MIKEYYDQVIFQHSVEFGGLNETRCSAFANLSWMIFVIQFVPIYHLPY